MVVLRTTYGRLVREDDEGQRACAQCAAVIVEEDFFIDRQKGSVWIGRFCSWECIATYDVRVKGDGKDGTRID
jgi:hypothetical protein